MNNDCIEYQGCRDSDGYGDMTRDGKGWAAHRWTWTQVFGPIPPGMCVLHKCDNPPCINPEHLFLGTPQDNVRDMDQKGRRRPGGNYKIPYESVLQIRALYDTSYKYSLESLAWQFNTSRSNVSRIVRNEQRREQ